MDQQECNFTLNVLAEWAEYDANKLGRAKLLRLLAKLDEGESNLDLEVLRLLEQGYATNLNCYFPIDGSRTYTVEIRCQE